MTHIRTVEYEADGLVLVGRLAVPEGDGPFPGVLIAHEGPGLDDIQIARADQMAERGYVGFALDYHGPLSPFSDRDAMRARLAELSMDPDRARTLATAALDVLVAEPTVDPDRLAAIGYCYGGTMAIELARTGADLKAVVGFHPGLVNIRPQDSAAITGRVLMMVGADDPIITLDQRIAFEEEMRAAGVDHQVHVYGGVQHSFTHPWSDLAGIDGVAYDATADARSTRSMLNLFDEVF